ncbi:hypothetical protein B0H16DRAFT_1510304 [Mycena metata]|uniref:Glycan binding protein Y3-like domain-containing protein n=1 Tax=Mycena metata TaxID=1033252 RepID=A0AAD7K1N3_9AGAR|nr:hypothetical protein B0H16DRAFT_1510304 [Mycena metata]
MLSSARLVPTLGLVLLALITKATCGHITTFCLGLVGPEENCSGLISGFCESAANNLLPPGQWIETCTEEKSPGGETGDSRFSCHMNAENMAATAQIPSVQLCEEVLLKINNTCQKANGGQAQAMGDSFVYNYYYDPGGCA